jgi:hypothetical protein
VRTFQPKHMGFNSFTLHCCAIYLPSFLKLQSLSLILLCPVLPCQSTWIRTEVFCNLGKPCFSRTWIGKLSYHSILLYALADWRHQALTTPPQSFSQVPNAIPAPHSNPFLQQWSPQYTNG